MAALDHGTSAFEAFSDAGIMHGKLKGNCVSCQRQKCETFSVISFVMFGIKLFRLVQSAILECEAEI